MCASRRSRPTWRTMSAAATDNMTVSRIQGPEPLVRGLGGHPQFWSLYLEGPLVDPARSSLGAGRQQKERQNHDRTVPHTLDTGGRPGNLHGPLRAARRPNIMVNRRRATVSRPTTARRRAMDRRPAMARSRATTVRTIANRAITRRRETTLRRRRAMASRRAITPSPRMTRATAT